MTSPFQPTPESFDKLYRGEPAVEGGPTPNVIPWDVRRPQPRLMELEALGGISGEVLDIGCGLGDNAIYLAARGHSVTALDGSPTAIEEARRRAQAAGVSVRFEVADATELTGFDGHFDTVVDSALYHCLDDDGRHAYLAAVHRAARPGARLHLACFSDGNVNGLISPGSVPVEQLREALPANGWHIDFLGPTTYLANAVSFEGGDDAFREAMEQHMPPEAVEHMRDMAARYEAIVGFLDGGLVHLPFTVVHAHRVD